MNKIGTLDIIKAYLGTKELTSTNAFIGGIPLIPQSGIPNDEIWYTSTDEQVVTPYQTGSLPTIVSNTYNGKGVIKFANDVTCIGTYVFYNRKNFTSIEIPNSVTSIGETAFAYCSGLTSIEIPNRVTTIGNDAFEGCRSLTSMMIPNNVTSIGYYAFYSCTSLTSISYAGTVAQWNAITKGNNWHNGVPATVVHCIDGDVSL